MNEQQMDKLTEGEIAALKYAQERGCRLPSWIETRGADYYRPHRLSAEDFAEYARLLDLYNAHTQTEHLSSIKGWVTFLGILVIIGIVATIISSCSAII